MDIDLAELQFGRACVYCCEIEDVVDDRQQCRGGFEHVAGIFTLLLVQRSDRAVAEKLNEADDVGERRAQLIADVVDEIIAQLFGSEQSCVHVGQRALDIHARSHVDEGEQCCAVRQRQRGAVKHRTIGAFEPPLEAGTAFGQTGNDCTKRAPRLFLWVQRAASFCQRIEMRLRAKNGGINSPQRGEGRICELQPAVGAKHRDAFLQRLERFALHTCQRVELRFEMEALGNVVEEVRDAALRIGIGDDAERAAVRQIPGLLARLDRLISRHEAVLPGTEVGLFGQAALGAQSIEDFRIARVVFEECRVERPEFAIRRIIEDKALLAIENRDAGRHLIKRAGMRFHLPLEICARGLEFAQVFGDRNGIGRRGHIDDIERVTFAGNDRLHPRAPDFAAVRGRRGRFAVGLF